MKHPTRIRPRTRLDAAVSLVYRYRHEIAHGLMVAAVLLTQWNAPRVLDITPTEKPRRKTSRNR